MAPACELAHGFPIQRLVADRVHDANTLHALAREQGGRPVTPPSRHRKHQHRYDRERYKQHWRIEAFSARLKQWRRITTWLTTSAPTPSSA